MFRFFFLITFIPLISPVLGFPPAPYETLYGVVRDQVGATIVAERAELILLRGDEEIQRVPILANAWVDRNYELKIKIDANRPQTDIYAENALPAGGLFNLAVELDGERFYPIETSAGLFEIGKGGGHRRLDLNLGADSDEDGLPDVWEQWQLYQAGYSPGDDGWDLSLIDRSGDLDNDGTSNWLEYIAGTFAGDATETFSMEIREKGDEHVRFEFFAVTGKTYQIERSSDGKVWDAVPFGLAEASELAAAQTAQTSGIQSAYCAPGIASTQFFRLTVR